MKAFKWLPAVAAVSLALTGCGSDSKSGGVTPGPGPSPTTFTWQLVYLKSEPAPSACAVYAVDESVSGNVIAAYSGNSTTNILIHNADGSVKEKRHPSSIGKITLSKSDIPDKGFVSVEELDGSIGQQQDVFMFAVQKEMMANLTINVRRSSASSGNCYITGESLVSTEVDSKAVINVGQVSVTTEQYRSNYIDRASVGSAVGQKVKVLSALPAQQQVLVTLFDDYGNNEAKNLTHYQLAAASFVYNSDDTSSQSVSPTNRGIVQPGLTVTDINLDTNTNNSLDVSYGNNLYEWQPIYQTSNNYSFITDQDPFSQWSFNLNGVTANSLWTYHRVASVDGNTKQITPPTLTSLNATVESNCALGGSFCLSSSGYTASDFNVQRSHIRSNTSNNARLFYQTIYSVPSNEVVLMNSSEETLVPDSNSNRIEVSLGKATISDAALKYFMNESVNVQNLVTSSLPNFVDANGPVTQQTSIKTRYLGLMGQDITTIKSGLN